MAVAWMAAACRSASLPRCGDVEQRSDEAARRSERIGRRSDQHTPAGALGGPGFTWVAESAYQAVRNDLSSRRPAG